MPQIKTRLIALHYFATLILTLCLATESEARQMYSAAFGTWGLAQNQTFQAAKDSGFDVVISSDVAKTEIMGLKCFFPFSVTKQIATDEAQWQLFVTKVKAVVSKYRGNKTVFGYYLADEPDWNQVPAIRFKELNAVIKSIDNSKPTFVILTIPSKWYSYLPFFDIIGIDPYLPNTHTGKETDKVKGWIDKINRDMIKLKINKPLWVVLGTFEEIPKNNSKPAFRKPTPAEFEVMIQTCLANHVSGIVIFSLSKDETASNYGWNLINNDPLLWDAVKKLPARISIID